MFFYYCDFPDALFPDSRAATSIVKAIYFPSLNTIRVGRTIQSLGASFAVSPEILVKEAGCLLTHWE